MADFEERADQLTLDAIDKTLSDGQIFREARKKLLSSGAKLLVGPRGTGKTHLMRYSYTYAMRNAGSPIALYANFSRYLNLEPLLGKSPDATKRFHSWVVAKLILSVFDFLVDANDTSGFLSSHNQLFDERRLRNLVGLLERGGGEEEYETFGQKLTINHALDAALLLKDRFRRKRIVFLLDDAALSLAGDYLIAFFEIFRLLKTDFAAPKASVYPGSTQYGPTFHASHEVELVPLWLSVEDAEYSEIMGDIAVKRYLQSDLVRISGDTIELLKYVAFGSPRAFLRLIREYLDLTAGSAQKKVNQIVERHVQLIRAEYDSLQIKLRQFASLIEMGRRLFDSGVQSIAAAQGEEPSARNIVLGIRQEATSNPLVERMMRFLIEVGMFYPLNEVSHGPNRRYSRYIPHLAFLQHIGAFRAGKGSSSRDISTYMRLPPAKHPVRRDFATLLGPDELARLKLDLPPCQKCGTARINESQRFCHNCGERLIDSSLFEDCMKLPLEQVPGISARLLARIRNDTQIRTVGHVFASQNASGDLQQAQYVGPIRAEGIVQKVALVVNEFLS